MSSVAGLSNMFMNLHINRVVSENLVPIQLLKQSTLFDLKDARTRLATFKGWQDSYFSPIELAVDGFYHTNYGDQIKCYNCGSEPEDWTNCNNLTDMHYGNCSLRNSNHENGAIDIWKKPSGVGSAQTPSSVAFAQTSTFTPRDTESTVNLTELKEENKRLKSSVLCKICGKSEVCILIMPCGHLPYCEHCIDPTLKCPVCDGVIKGYIKTYRA